MKAIILAGGTGSRLYPLTAAISKQLQAVYDKPLIFYSLTALIAAKLRDFCIISDPNNLSLIARLLGDGRKLGISIHYVEQVQPKGVAEAYLLAENFIGSDSSIMILGDNIFSGGNDISKAVENFKDGGSIFSYRVNNPEDYGVIKFDANMEPLEIVEKPTLPVSKFAIPGAYIYDSTVVAIAKNLVPSERGELEITDINRAYLKKKALTVNHLSRGYVWIDVGPPKRLHEAASYVEMIEHRQGIKIGCPEEAALVRGFISLDQFADLVKSMPTGDYRKYLETVYEDHQTQAESTA